MICNKEICVLHEHYLDYMKNWWCAQLASSAAMAAECAGARAAVRHARGEREQPGAICVFNRGNLVFVQLL